MAEASEIGSSGEQKALAGVSGLKHRSGPFLIVGLGNPGLEYVWTPHNAGFMAIDRIAQQEGVVVQNRRCRATTATCRIAGRQVVLAKPETFMNLSGAAVAALVQEFEADPAQDLLVIYDELDLVLGTFKIRERGSPAGHNGARSVTSALGTQEWLRLRIGVGPDLPPEAIVAGGGSGRAGIICSRPCARRIWRCWTRCWTGWQRPRAASSKQGPAAAMNEFNRQDRDSGTEELETRDYGTTSLRTVC